MRRPILTLSTLPLLAGCIGMGGGTASDAVDAEQVIREIKRDLADYALYEAVAAAQPPLPNACGGQVNFRVQTVTVALTTVSGVTDDGSVGAEVPIGGITLGPKGAYSRSRESSQTISFTLVSKAPDGAAGRMAPAAAPGTFYAALRSLREAMLRARDTPPCLTFPEPKDQENSIEFGFTVTRDRSAGGEISFLIFSLGAERKSSQAVGNTVSVAFVADPGILIR